MTTKPALLLLLICALLALGIGCDSDDDTIEDEQGTFSQNGLVSVGSDLSVSVMAARLTSAINNNDAVSIVADINHEANAQSAGLSLSPTRVILFGNPNLGTPLMQANQQAGLDLPQKMLFWEDEDGNVRVGYNAVDYLQRRHSLTGVDEPLNMIAGALKGLAETASGATIDEDEISSGGVTFAEGILSVTSTFGVDETFNRLQQAVQDAGPLSVMASLDHAANAASVGLPLRPTRLLVFGNPNLGTPLMQNSQRIGIDLPQKMLVYEDADGTVFIIYNDPFYLAERHGIESRTSELEQVSAALENLANGAAGL